MYQTYLSGLQWWIRCECACRHNGNAVTLLCDFRLCRYLILCAADFRLEGENAEETARNFAHKPTVKVPRIFKVGRLLVTGAKEAAHTPDMTSSCASFSLLFVFLSCLLCQIADYVFPPPPPLPSPPSSAIAPPLLLQQYTTPRVLTMEFMPGFKVLSLKLCCPYPCLRRTCVLAINPCSMRIRVHFFLPISAYAGAPLFRR